MKLIMLTTPIGNVGDCSSRLIEHLTGGELFFVEDTRRFYQLLDILNIDKSQKKVVVFNDHKQETVSYCLELLQKYEVGYIASDAGSPILSDPAFPLVKAVIDQEGKLESIPGASAALVALEVSGLPPSPFMFHGFLPRQQGEIAKVFSSLPGQVTHCFFESPNRLAKTLALISEHRGESDVVVVRELTKKFEEHYRFRGHVGKEFCDNIHFKGEFVLLIRPDDEVVTNGGKYEELARDYMKKPSSKKLAKLLAGILNEKTETIYNDLNIKKN